MDDTRRKAYSNTTSTTTIPPLSRPGLNSGFRGYRPKHNGDRALEWTSGPQEGRSATACTTSWAYACFSSPDRKKTDINLKLVRTREKELSYECSHPLMRVESYEAVYCSRKRDTTTVLHNNKNKRKWEQQDHINDTRNIPEFYTLKGIQDVEIDSGSKPAPIGITGHKAPFDLCRVCWFTASVSHLCCYQQMYSSPTLRWLVRREKGAGKTNGGGKG